MVCSFPFSIKVDRLLKTKERSKLIEVRRSSGDKSERKRDAKGGVGNLQEWMEGLHSSVSPRFSFLSGGEKNDCISFTLKSLEMEAESEINGGLRWKCQQNEYKCERKCCSTTTQLNLLRLAYLELLGKWMNLFLAHRTLHQICCYALFWSIPHFQYPIRKL